jgi:hypothetical protein
MNQPINGKEKFYLTKKRTNQPKTIFSITKSKKETRPTAPFQKLKTPEIAVTDDSFETATESSQLSPSSSLHYENHILPPLPSPVILFENISFPDFFNDKPINTDLRTLEQYEKVCESFNDNEEVELYLIRKESVLSSNNQ